MAKAEVETVCVKTVKLTLDQLEAQVLWDILANVSAPTTSPRGEAFYSTLIALEDALLGKGFDLDNTGERTSGVVEVLDV